MRRLLALVVILVPLRAGSNVTKLVDANVQLKRWDDERLSWIR